MAKTRTGSSSILHLARKICKLKAVFGAADLAAKTTPEFAAAVAALVAACTALELLDDYVGEIDTHAPFGPEDLEPA